MIFWNPILDYIYNLKLYDSFGNVSRRYFSIAHISSSIFRVLLLSFCFYFIIHTCIFSYLSYSISICFDECLKTTYLPAHWSRLLSTIVRDRTKFNPRICFANDNSIKKKKKRREKEIETLVESETEAVSLGYPANLQLASGSVIFFCSLSSFYSLYWILYFLLPPLSLFLYFPSHSILLFFFFSSRNLLAPYYNYTPGVFTQ